MPETAANSKSTGATEVTALFTLITCLRFKARFPNKKPSLQGFALEEKSQQNFTSGEGWMQGC